MSGHGAPTLAASDLDGSQLKVAVVASRWHEQIMDGLLDGAQRALAEAGVQDPAIVRVAGSRSAERIVDRIATIATPAMPRTVSSPRVSRARNSTRITFTTFRPWVSG